MYAREIDYSLTAPSPRYFDGVTHFYSSSKPKLVNLSVRQFSVTVRTT